MKNDVMWRPRGDNATRVGNGRFRDILDKKFGFPHVLRISEIPYLEGLSDCGFDEAKILIDAIYSLGEIEIFIWN